MGTTKTKQAEKAGKRRAVVYLDQGVFRRLRDEHVERDMPVSHIVEECLARRYAIESPIVTAWRSRRRSQTQQPSAAS